MKEEIHNDRMISDDIIQVGNVSELNSPFVSQYLTILS